MTLGAGSAAPNTSGEASDGEKSDGEAGDALPSSATDVESECVRGWHMPYSQHAVLTYSSECDTRIVPCSDHRLSTTFRRRGIHGARSYERDRGRGTGGGRGWRASAGHRRAAGDAQRTLESLRSRNWRTR